MPRSGGGIYSKGSPSAVSGTTIQSAAYNTTIDDLVTDANAARPISAGGTGAVNAADARTNLAVAAVAGSASQVFSVGPASANDHAVSRSFASAGLYRNRIVNGSMQISQERGTALVDVTNGGVYTVDQWVAFLSSTPGGTLRAQQVASVTPAGSPFRLRFTAQAADASIAAGDIYTIVQSIEGQMIADALFGTASARQIAIRFGVRSSLAGTFGVRLTNSAANRSYVTTITIAGGEINTDLLRTVVIPGDTAGTWLNDTGVGLILQITLAAGTTFQSTAGSWQNANVTTTSGQTNFMGTASATFELFDVGLYVDQLAVGVFPPFEVPAWDADLRACQRYWQTQEMTARFTASAATEFFETPVYWETTMRIAPVTSGPTGGTVSNCFAAINSPTPRFARFLITSTAAGDAFYINAIATANARF